MVCLCISGNCMFYINCPVCVSELDLELPSYEEALQIGSQPIELQIKVIFSLELSSSACLLIIRGDTIILSYSNNKLCTSTEFC